MPLDSGQEIHTTGFCDGMILSGGQLVRHDDVEL